MTVEDIVEEHRKIIQGNRIEAIPNPKIKYHTEITIKAIIEELEILKNTAILYENTMEFDIEDRIQELQNLIDNG